MYAIIWKYCRSLHYFLNSWWLWPSEWFDTCCVCFIVCDRWIKVSSCTSESKLHPGNWKWLVWKGEKFCFLVLYCSLSLIPT